MSTELQRQRQRQEAEIAASNVAWQRRLAAFDDEHGPGTALRGLARAHESRARLETPLPRVTKDQLAIVARHLEPIIAAKHPKTGEVISRTDRVVSLIDVMHKDKQLDMELWHAGSRYRDLFLRYMGHSRGVSSYGDYIEPSPASQRVGVTDLQMSLSDELRAATAAAFGVSGERGELLVDEHLMHLVIPAIISDKKAATQGLIGRERTHYKAASQGSAAGGAIVAEVLHRLAIHFGYKRKSGIMAQTPPL